MFFPVDLSVGSLAVPPPHFSLHVYSHRCLTRSELASWTHYFHDFSAECVAQLSLFHSQWALDDSQVCSQPLNSFPTVLTVRTAPLSSASQATCNSHVSFKCCHSPSCSSGVAAFEPSTFPHSYRCLGEMSPSHLSIDRGIPQSQAPIHFSAGALSLSFPTASVVPMVFSSHLLSLARLRQALGPF